MAPGIVRDWIAFNLLQLLNLRDRVRLLRRYGSPGDIAFRVPPEELSRATARQRPGMFPGKMRQARETLEEEAGEEHRRCRRMGIRLLPLDDPEYPALLREIADPPVLLYRLGRPRADAVRVAVVGSRAPTLYGTHTATSLAGNLAAAGVEVVSGGARGIDSCAHTGALEAGGSTVSVLGSGLANPYPVENGDLFGRISENGAIFSEFPLNFPPNKFTFPQRNRIISGVSAAVVVVEAESRSGSLITAGLALDQDREVLAVPGPVSSRLSAGCNRLIREGAGLARGAGDVLAALPAMYRKMLGDGPVAAGVPRGPEASRMNADERAVAALLDSVEPLHLDDLAERAPMGIARLQAALFGLEVQGAVEQTPGRYYLLRPQEES